jgi:tetratricopeptide (TPR) repeat protein
MLNLAPRWPFSSGGPIGLDADAPAGYNHRAWIWPTCPAARLGNCRQSVEPAALPRDRTALWVFIAKEGPAMRHRLNVIAAAILLFLTGPEAQGQQPGGNLDKVIAEYTEAIRVDPGFAKAYYTRGGAWESKREYDRACADFNEAVRLASNVIRAQRDRDRAQDLKRESREDSASDRPASPLSTLLDRAVELACIRSDVLKSMGDFDRAIAAADEALRLDPAYYPAFLCRAFAREEKGDRDEAIADCNRAARLRPELATPVFLRARLRDAKGDPEKALDDYNEAIRLEPENATAFTVRAIHWSSKGAYDKAMTDFDRAIALDPQNAGAHGGLAWMCATCPDAGYRNGKLAVASATRACELKGWMGDRPLSVLAAACAEAGDFEAAVNWQQKAVELQKVGKDEEEGLARLALYQARMPYRDETDAN